MYYYWKDKPMNKSGCFIAVLAVISGCFLTGPARLLAAEQGESLVLFSFDRDFDIGSVVTSDAKVTRAVAAGLRIETGHEKPWPGVTMKAPAGKWDLSGYENISLDVKNIADEPVTVSCRVDNPGADGNKNCVTDNITLAGGEQGTLTVRIFPVPWKLSEPLELIGMRGYPVHAGKVDTSNITQMLLYVARPRIDHIFEIRNICAGGSVTVLDAKTFLPFIDDFGQYVHRDWPGKTHSIDELKAHGKAEQKDLSSHPGPADRNKYGVHQRKRSIRNQLAVQLGTWQ